ncbi:MAG: hypothetical protein MMC23_000646 [Stictis urceolatum]|nr:hypothetical protein [Stictis urceolata]
MPRRNSRSSSPPRHAVIYDPATLEFETLSLNEFESRAGRPGLTEVKTNGRSLVDIYLDVGSDPHKKAYFTTVDLSKLPLPVRWNRRLCNADHIYVKGEH